MILLFALAAVDAAPIPVSAAAVKPAFVSGTEPPYPTEARAQGHHGKVVARATVTVDGSLKDIKIEQSSKSSLLDALVLNALPTWKLSPAKDAAGNPIEVTGLFPFDYKGDGLPGGYLVRYRCDRFLRDMSWWRSVNPGVADEKHELYTMLLGLRVLSHSGGMMAGLASKKVTTEVKADWDRALSKCSSNPDRLMIDHLQIGSMIRKLTEAENRNLR